MIGVAALKVTFRSGLNTEMLTELACQDDQLSLNSLINIDIYLNNLLWNHQAIQGALGVS